MKWGQDQSAHRPVPETDLCSCLIRLGRCLIQFFKQTDQLFLIDVTGGFWNGRSYEHETRLGRIPFFALKFIQSTASQLFSQVELIIVIL